MLDTILFMGTPDFAVPTLNALVQSFPDSAIHVVTMPDKVRGRGKKVSYSPVKAAALDLSLNLFTPASKSEITDLVKQINPDLTVVIAYGMIIEKTIVDQYFCINLHASLLPKYRGASPIQSVLLNGDSITGVTVIKLNEYMDEGDMLRKMEFQIDESMNCGELTLKLSELAAECCIDFINKDFLVNDIKSITQNESQATYCSKIKKEDLLIDQGDRPDSVFRKIKAFSPKPASYCVINNKRIKLLDAELKNGKLLLNKVQPEGKGPMTYTDYLLGYPKGINFNDN